MEHPISPMSVRSSASGLRSMRLCAVKLLPGISCRDWSGILAELPEGKARRISGYRNERDALRSAVGHMLVMLTAADCLGVGRERLNLSRNPYGKPFFEGAPDFHFNISHSGDWVVALFDRSPVGVDVQEMKDADMDLASRFFSASERIELEACGESGRTGLFFGFWTLKESYLKAIGKGLTVPLESFSMRLSEEGITAAAEHGPLPFFFRRFFLDEGHALSACAASGNFPLEAERMDQEALVRRFLSRPP